MREVANLARDTLSSLPALTHTDCPLQAVKLQCMAKTVESPLYVNPGKGSHTVFCFKVIKSELLLLETL